MSLCCEIGCRECLPLGISVGGNPPPSLYAAPVVKNPPRKAHKRRFALSECIYASSLFLCFMYCGR
ncbi:Hypothetical protein FKW44_010792 [Caligus rogercresseyi]|uniref:Uncharacterized protein n=1 Tax=Caligus rogercresseyi TaxID=217165 RepID=A0A7T8HHD5_CALRO|nr:Hypothetical protein FKW44_010792 [Caligus rogercresseyi]